jgi:tetratricopeptide (TPR) repeat protein
MFALQEWRAADATRAWRRLSLALALPLALPLAAHADNVTDLMERGRWKDARAAVATLPPGQARTLYLQSRVQLAFDKPEDALASAERAAQLEPRNAAYHEQLAEACGNLAQRAGKLKAFGLARRLRKEAEQAVALDARQIEAREVLVNFFWLAPGIVGGDKNKATAMANEIARLSPGRGALVQAELAMRAKQEARAESLYLRALDTEATSYTAHILLARLYGGDTKNRWDLAEKHARTAMAADPGRSGAYSVLAAVLAHGQRWNELETLFAEAGRRLPSNLTPQYQAARLLLAEHRDSLRAERYLRQYLGGEPEGGAPSLARARWRLGQALERQGRRREAVAELEAAVKMDPSFDDAKKDLKRMKRG